MSNVFTSIIDRVAVDPVVFTEAGPYYEIVNDLCDPRVNMFIITTPADRGDGVIGYDVYLLHTDGRLFIHNHKGKFTISKYIAGAHFYLRWDAVSDIPETIRTIIKMLETGNEPE